MYSLSHAFVQVESQRRRESDRAVRPRHEAPRVRRSRDRRIDVATRSRLRAAVAALVPRSALVDR